MKSRAAIGTVFVCLALFAGFAVANSIGQTSTDTTSSDSSTATGPVLTPDDVQVDRLPPPCNDGPPDAIATKYCFSVTLPDGVTSRSVPVSELYPIVASKECDLMGDDAPQAPMCGDDALPPPGDRQPYPEPTTTSDAP